MIMDTKIHTLSRGAILILSLAPQCSFDNAHSADTTSIIDRIGTVLVLFAGRSAVACPIPLCSVARPLQCCGNTALQTAPRLNAA